MKEKDLSFLFSVNQGPFKALQSWMQQGRPPHWELEKWSPESPEQQDVLSPESQPMNEGVPSPDPPLTVTEIGQQSSPELAQFSITSISPEVDQILSG